jgi:putative Holliday junction resolvase
MRHLGIDYGKKRVGLAMSDAGGRFVTPMTVLQVGNDDDAIRQVANVVEREEPDVLVLGLPINMDGTEGGSATNVRLWGQKLTDLTRLAVRLVDERQTSLDAEAELAARRRGGEKLTHKRKKRRLDAVAAAGFLQNHLEGSLPAVDTLVPAKPAGPAQR